MKLDLSRPLENLFSRASFGIYIHVPFCMRRCRYCAFVSSTPAHVPDQAYTEAILTEFAMRIGDYANHSLKTLYFGGGTPTMLPDAAIGRIVEKIVHQCGSPDEITLEANPEHVSSERSRNWKSIGFTRVSLGVQSFDSAMLAFLGRRHDARMALDAVSHLTNAGFGEISIDLIYGGQTECQDPIARWRRDLEAARDSGAKHVSCYELTIEPHTPLWTMQKRGTPVVCSDDAIADMMAIIPETLGMMRYEISNYCRDGYASAHNLSCWSGLSYLGLGAGAHSLLVRGEQITRQANTRDPRRYMAALNAETPALPEPDFVEHLTPRAHLAERLMCAARTRLAFNPNEIAAQIGADPAPYIPGLQKAVSRGLIESLPNAQMRTTPNGISLNNLLDEMIFEGYE